MTITQHMAGRRWHLPADWREGDGVQCALHAHKALSSEGGRRAWLVSPATRPLRFVMVVSGYPPTATAGMERGCQRLSRALVNRGHDVRVLTTAVEHAAAVVVEEGVRVHRELRPWPVGPLWGLTYMRQVRRWLAAADPWDVVMCHQLYLHSPVANRVAHRLGRKSIHLLVAAQSQSDIGRLAELRGGRRLVEEAVSGADLLFALSSHSRRELLDAGAPADKVRAYRYFVDAPGFAQPAGSSTRQPEVLFIGRFHDQKNVPLLLDAFDVAAAEVPDMRLRLVGQGPKEASVRARVERSPFVSRISIEPWSDDPRAAYRRASVMAMSSDAEGLSNVLIEAMASGTAVVSTDVSGAREALGVGEDESIAAGGFLEGEAGLLTRLGDAAGLAAALTMLMKNGPLRDRLGAAGLRRALASYSEEASASDFLRHVSALVAA